MEALTANTSLSVCRDSNHSGASDTAAATVIQLFSNSGVPHILKLMEYLNVRYITSGLPLATLFYVENFIVQMVVCLM